jgi:hypothetical protein
MTLRLNDTKLASLYKSLETQRASNPSLQIGKDQVLKLLAEVADKSNLTSAKALAQLSAPTATLDQQVALVKAGMSASEKKDLAAILDQGTVPLDATAKSFLEKVLDRGTTPTPTPTTGLNITGNQHDGLSGVTKAGATIEAINISAAPGGRLHMDDTMVVGTADSTGHFANAKLTGDQAVHEGDLIRMRARYADGTTSDWVTVKAQGVEAKDTRNAVVALQRIGMTDAGNGSVAVTNINDSRQISEPGAKLQFTNLRTNEKTVATIDETGNFPKNFTLKGKAGDSFSVAATDGTNNTAFTTAIGNVTVPGGTPGTGDLVPDPAMHKDELNADGTPKFSKVRYTGPLFVDGPSADDVQQGQLGDCYCPAGFAAIAKANPDFINNLIKDNGDGTYTVTFKQKDWSIGKYKDVPVKVDGDLWSRSYGGPVYGHSANSGDAKKMELWFPLCEKAYAQWKGSYNDIGNGGLASDIFEAVTGKEGAEMSITGSNNDKVWSQITKAVDAHTPVAAGTYGEDQNAKYTNTGVYADHAYSIMGYETQGADKYVVLRNPWGESEPAGNGANDGVFKLKLDQFAKLYQTLMYTN